MGRELTPNRIAPFTSGRCLPVVLCGISTCFQVLSPCLGQIAHALLTRPPLEYQPSGRNLPINIPARLACVKHAASVRPEPGSNSYVQSLRLFGTSSQARQSLSPRPSRSRLLSQNLTVLFRSPSSDVNLIYISSLYRFQGSRCHITAF